MLVLLHLLFEALGILSAFRAADAVRIHIETQGLKPVALLQRIEDEPAPTLAALFLDINIPIAGKYRVVLFAGVSWYHRFGEDGLGVQAPVRAQDLVQGAQEKMPRCEN